MTSCPMFGGRTAVLHGVEDIRVEERPLPVSASRKLAAHEVLIAPRCVGICGSDMHYYLHAQIGGRDIPFPDVHRTRFGGVLGHEAAGSVVAVGSGVTRVAVGDRVAIEAGVPCGMCRASLSGRYNLCPNMRFLGSFLSDFSGALTERMVHREEFCFKLPAGVSYEEAALLEPLSVAMHACRRGSVRAGDRVLVTGAGPVGIMVMLAARAFGATDVGITDINPQRLAAALRLGGGGTGYHLPADTAAFEASPEWDVAVECSGAAPALTACMDRVRRGGSVVLVGMGSLNVPMRPAQLKELTVAGVFRYCNTYDTALQLVASGRLDLKPLVTHHFELNDVQAAFQALKTDPTAIKIMIHPNAAEAGGGEGGGDSGNGGDTEGNAAGGGSTKARNACEST